MLLRSFYLSGTALLLLCAVALGIPPPLRVVNDATKECGVVHKLTPDAECDRCVLISDDWRVLGSMFSHDCPDGYLTVDSADNCTRVENSEDCCTDRNRPGIPPIIGPHPDYGDCSNVWSNEEEKQCTFVEDNVGLCDPLPQGWVINELGLCPFDFEWVSGILECVEATAPTTFRPTSGATFHPNSGAPVNAESNLAALAVAGPTVACMLLFC